jgi:low temperature requirement protein LtrA
VTHQVTARRREMLRDRERGAPVSNAELFFDLVYVFAVTQLSHGLLAHLSIAGALRTGLLLIMVWLLWAYTTWVTNWLDPGRLGRSAYHLIHPVMVAGIIVVAAADDLVLKAPGAVGRADVAWLALGGTALFLAGHAAFKAVAWHRVSSQRAGAVAVLGLLGLAAPHLAALALGICVVAVIAAVAVCDRLQQGGSP